MDNEVLIWVRDYLKRDEDIVVPVKKLWNEWHTQRAEPSLDAFSTLVLADDAIETMGGVDHAEGFEDWSPEELEAYRQEMEAAGYYSGLRVKLKARALTLEHIVKMITRHNDRMEDALRQARATMPEDIAEDQEGMLIDAQVQVAKLREQLRDAGLYAEGDEAKP
jgi:hypothetical protein